MASRTSLQTILETLLGSDAVYFQPPPTVQMVYPCIIYEHSNSDTQFADNNPYIYKKRYQVSVVDKNPDSLIPDKIAALATCIFDRHYMADNLNHYVFVLYF